jgi:hypothetical protein
LVVASKSLVVAWGSVVLGASVALFNMVDWSVIENSVASSSRAQSTVLNFFLAQGVATALVVITLYEIYKILLSRRGAENRSTLSVMGDALSSRRALRLGVVVGVVYAAIYSFFSSFIVYQPTVDFAAAYGVSRPGWAFVACCGDAGTVPKLIVYLSPSLHLGMQLVPLTLLFLFLIPILVAFNVTLSYYAFRLSPFPLSGGWLASSGAIVGLFTACPTCAGLFLASGLGGLGTALAVSLAPYQVLFVGITVPILVFGPVLTALSVKRSYEASCRLDTIPRVSKIETA